MDLKSYQAVKIYVKIASDYFVKKLIRSIELRDIDTFKAQQLKTLIVIELKK
jgi:hypothetical protein